MAYLSPDDYNRLESTITQGGRIVVFRRGTEYIVAPLRLTMMGGREAIEAVHPTTGDPIVFVLDEIDSFEVVR